MRRVDPLLSAYRDATELYFRVSDMPSDVAACFVALACEGRDLVRSSVQALRGDDSGGVAAPPEGGSSVSTIAASLYRFAEVSEAESAQDISAFLPSAHVASRERTLVELIKLDQKARWSRRQPKPLELYLREWPELRESRLAVEELLRSECLARSVFGTGATGGELALRFPAVAASVRLDEIDTRAQVIHRGLSLAPASVSGSIPERFSVLRELGRGGMGVVYEVTDRERGSRVALKTLPRMDPQALFRFKREFRTLAGLTHPNLVSLYELVSDGTQWLFTMDLVEGVDFITHIRRVHGGDHQVLRRALAQLGEGLQALHRNGILHCDLKPSNVLVRHDGCVVILDFGVAVQMSSGVTAAAATASSSRPMVPDVSPEVTWTGYEEVLGSVAYMSPEQAAGGRLSAASDWYSVGVMLYEALTGTAPFANRIDPYVAKQFEDPPPPRAIAAGVPEDLERLCIALLDRNPAVRPTGEEILDQTLPQPRRDRKGSSAGRSAPFVGRSSHLGILASAYRELERHSVATVHVRGRSGVGKTALAQRFLASLPRDTVTLTGRCYEQESVPYKAVDSVIDALCRHLLRLSSDAAASLMPRDIAALARMFPVLERVDSVRIACRESPEIADVRELRRRAFTAFGDMLERLGKTAPLVLLIDDLQWGDVDSAAILTSVLGSHAPPRLLFVACYRSEHAETSPCLVALNAARNHLASFDVDVDVLTYDESVQLASLLLGDEEHEQRVASRVARESGGNPFFVSELARQVQGAPSAADALRTAAVDLDEALWSRVIALPVPARTLLEVVAVGGKPLPLGSAARAASIGEHAAGALAALHAERLVRSTGLGSDDHIETYHDRIRETIVHHLSEPERVGHHWSLAVALEAGSHPDAEEIASHFHRAGLRGEAAHHYAIAAEKAAGALAFDRSAELFGLALALRDVDDADSRVLRIRRADALANAGRGYESGREYQRATTGADERSVITLQRNAGYQYFVSGHIDEGRNAFGVVLAHFGMKLPQSRRRALLALLWRRLQLQLRGIGFRERQEAEIPQDDLDRVDVFWSIAAGMTIADPIRGADFQTHDLILALRAGEPYRIARALAWDAAHVSMLGVWFRKRVMNQLAVAEALARRVDRPHATGMTLMSRGVAAYFQGDFAECQRCTEAAITIFSDQCTGASWELETCNAFALWPLYFKGEYRALTHRFGRLIGEVRERGARLAEADLTTFGGPFVWLAADDPDGAEVAVRGVMGEWSHQDFQVQHFTTLTAEAQISLYRGNADEAWNRVNTQWNGLADAMLLHVEIVRIYMTHLRARCALAAARTGNRSPLLRHASRDARRLERERPAYAGALAKTIRAAIAHQRGDARAAEALLRQAGEELTTLGWGCFGIAARRQHGQLLGGTIGRRLVDDIDADLLRQGVKRPDRLCAVQIPGFETVSNAV
jgi:serine/threonine protein kinase